MCKVTLYKGSVKEENKLIDDVSRYSLDLNTGKLTVYPLLQEPKEFKITKGISWDESNDSMIIE
ncbi:MAG: hypothetical protein CVU88_00995 [Firmicutes bacterium HGW-Firmicutes-13]|nr:MAG: hypothetical protein CVU88_00995 [Firmicutes bacterium HGW-Firmicutes-13]